MHTITMTVKKYEEEILLLVRKFLFNSKIKVEENKLEEGFQFSFYGENEKVFADVAFIATMTSLIYEIILSIYFPKNISERVDKICYDYTSFDKEDVEKLSTDLLYDIKIFPIEKAIIREEILNYVIENSFIYLDGFISFRVRRFLYMVDILIEKGIEKFKEEKAHFEFISMLQYFVDIGEAKEDLINLIFREDYYLLKDKDNEMIESKMLNLMEGDKWYKNLSEGDVLVSTLIHLCPKKLIVHIEEGKEKDLLDLLKKVFRDRVEFCHGCSTCNINN